MPRRKKKTQVPPANGVYHFLDVGEKPYGDCILIEFGALRVLIDGSHVGDFEGQVGHDSIPLQIQTILGGAPPYDIDLLVVTHCHADHIGCLPQLVSERIIRSKFALVTDPSLGFGRILQDAGSFSDLAGDPQSQIIAAGLREEDASFLNDNDLAGFLDAAAGVEGRYATFLDDLKARGTKVIVHNGDQLPAELVTLMKPSGMKLFGPSALQIQACARQIGKINKDASDLVSDRKGDFAGQDMVSLFRSVMVASVLDDASGGRGAGMNCQSITLAFGPPESRVLLAGDMQFAQPGVTGADGEVRALRAAVVADGPYRLFKTTHHTAENGQDEGFLIELGNPPLIVHTGGRRDGKHPNRDVLATLTRRGANITFARTDRNGIISVKPQLFPAKAAVTLSGGAFNDFSTNRDDDNQARKASEVAMEKGSLVRGTGARSAPQVIIVNLPEGPVSMQVDGVSIAVDDQRQVYISTGKDEPQQQIPKGKSLIDEVAKVAAATALGGGRSLPPLLFVSNRALLTKNIGAQEASAALSMITAAGQRLIDVEPMTAPAQVKAALLSGSHIDGVVILGGYDVVPSFPTDVLDPEIRTKLGGLVRGDHDQFTVWSDEIYGDTDGDRVGELPVSRIPDGRDAALVFAALSAGAPKIEERYGIRNIARPFAEDVWNGVVGKRKLNVSEEFQSEQVVSAELSRSANYIMLHGSDSDGRVFSGEFSGGGFPTALEADSIPETMQGIVFAGCCWGALVVSEKAVNAPAIPSPRVPERSIALTCLRAGASAFVGCTGSHYSGPSIDPDENFALVLHSAFWAAAIDRNFAAAPALFQAREFFSDYITMRSNGADPLYLARLLKNRGQFTCLGLGW